MDPISTVFPPFTTTSDTYAHHLYSDAFEDHDVDSFLEETCVYSSSTSEWTLPMAPTTAESLVDSFCSIIGSIVRRFVKSPEAGVERVPKNTQGAPEYDSIDEKGRRSYPPIVLHATGPSFPNPERVESPISASQPLVGYTQIATFFSVKLESEVVGYEREVEEMETYARRVLHAQPSRFYVRCISLTQKHARLIQFDRAGVEVTPPIDIHRYASTLVRLIAGLGSTDERLLGIDTSIQWPISNGRKAKGTLTTTGPSGESRVYRILGRIPTPRYSIYGRATTCWRVQDPDTLEELVVKDSWRPEHRPGEYELLELVKGIPGVVQMISYETGRGETKDFRCPTTAGGYGNRVATRVTLKSYGPSIERFTSAPQMLCAMRDAIAGHGKLLADDIRVLHRDVAAQNVLLGRHDSPPGERGVLIDLDLAFMATDAVPTVKVDYNIGLRVFQSLSVLRSLYYEDTAPAHDYLDDLESFLYLLVYLFLLYRPDGSRFLTTDEGPSIVLTWNHDDVSKAFAKKGVSMAFGQLPRLKRLIQNSWGPVCTDLFTEFRAWVRDRRDEKGRLLRQEAGLAAFLSNREKHYSQILAMFDKAIDDIAPDSTPSQVTPNAASVFLPGDGALGPIPDVSPTPPISSSPVPNTQIKAPPHQPTVTPYHLEPTVVPTPFIPAPAQPLRRSARTRQLEKKPNLSIPAKDPLPLVPTQMDPPPRRSERIRKRLLEEDVLAEQPRPKTRRITKRLRSRN